MERITVRRADAQDTEAISRLLEINRLPGTAASGGESLVAEERQELLAAVRCSVRRGRLVLGPLAIDPWIGEYRFAVALYTAARSLAHELGKRQVWADCDAHREYLLETGYRRRVGGWRLDVDPSPAGQRLALADCLTSTDLAFFRPFWGP